MECGRCGPPRRPRRVWRARAGQTMEPPAPVRERWTRGAMRRRAPRRALERLMAIPARIYPDESFPRFTPQKKPRKMPGRCRAAFSLAKNGHPLQLERVAWLTAMLPLTVAGPRPILTALPHFPSLQIEGSV